jgi:cell division protease FtsH
MKRMLNQIAMGLGGRIAEEIVMGDISSGAAGDIKHITKLARHMVCDWGMSPLGPVAYGDNQAEVFLGRDITRNDVISEETARRIDAEIHRIIDEQYKRAKVIILEKREALEKIAAALIQYETIEGRHVLEILQHGEIRSPVVPIPPPKLEDKGGKKSPEKAATSDPIGGVATPSPTPA